MGKELEESIGVKKGEKRTRISQLDVPAYGLTDALRIAQAIDENYASKPTRPLDVAAAMGITPTSSTFKMLAGASIAYGLTEGGYNAPTISITSLGRRITAPLEEGADRAAMKEALLKPRIIGEFLQNYDGKPLPRDEIAKNVLSSMGCPRDRSEDILELMVSEAEKVGFITSIKGKQYVNLRNSDPIRVEEDAKLDESDDGVDLNSDGDKNLSIGNPSRAPAVSGAISKRVFITHGKNKTFIDPIKRLLIFGEMDPVVSVESQSVSQPVPEKVMADMRSCGAAIIHVAAENKLIDNEAKEHIVLNPNVLIEIGAAMALYGKRFILLVREGVQLPSNLQGLYEVRYSGEALDGDTTIRLMEAIKALKAAPAI